MLKIKLLTKFPKCTTRMLKLVTLFWEYVKFFLWLKNIFKYQKKNIIFVL